LQLLEPQVLAACATALIVCSVLALIVSFIVRYFGLTRKDFRLLLFVLLAFSLLGFVTGQIMGQSREPAVMAVLPAVLTLLGGIVIYLVGAKGIQTQAIVASMVCCFAIALLIGVHFGGRLRVDFDLRTAAYTEDNRHAVEVRRLERYVDFLKLKQDFADKEKLDLSRFDSMYEQRPPAK
jgi:hypothetical protein